MLVSQLFHFIIVYAARFFIQVVANGMIENTGCVDATSVRQMASMIEVESHECIARLQYGQQNGGICLCARVWLYVGKLGSEEFFDTCYRQILDLVNNLATTIITLCRKTFSVFVC